MIKNELDCWEDICAQHWKHKLFLPRGKAKVPQTLAPTWGQLPRAKRSNTKHEINPDIIQMGFTEKNRWQDVANVACTVYSTSNYDVSHMIYSIDLHSAQPFFWPFCPDCLFHPVVFTSFSTDSGCDSTAVPGLLPLCQAISAALDDVGLRLRSGVNFREWNLGL